MSFMRPYDIPIWLAAKPWLNVRSNDEHTLISYRLGQALLRLHPEATENIVLPAILMHDVGWKMFPEGHLAQAVGPNPKYPELQRAHEIEGARIARAELENLSIVNPDLEAIVEIIDGHDTRKVARSIEDALMKDADKLWRFTAHGVQTISGWFDTPAKGTVAMLEDFVLPSFLTAAGKAMAQALLAESSAAAWLDDTLNLKALT